MGCKILGVGGYLPGSPVLNTDLQKFFEVDDEWIKTRTGISQRYFTHGSSVNMAFEAAQSAISDANIEKDTIDLVIVASTTPDIAFPSTATQVHGMLGLNAVPSFDINAVCSGFVFGLHIVQSLLQAYKYKRALLIGVDKMSSVLDMSDRSTAVLFGDGAGAVIVERSDNLFDSYIGSDGSFANILGTKKSTEGNEKIFMNGKEVYKEAVNKMFEISKNLLTSNNLNISDIDFFVPHQANKRIIEAVSEKLGFESNKVVSTVSVHANTSSATIPLALNEIRKLGKLKDLNKVLMVAIGAGLTYGGVLLEV